MPQPLTTWKVKRWLTCLGSSGKFRRIPWCRDGGAPCSNRQGRHHLLPPGGPSPDLIEQVRYITACAVKILPLVPGAYPLGPHAAEDEALPGCVHVKRRGLEAPDSWVEELLQFHIWTNNLWSTAKNTGISFSNSSKAGKLCYYLNILLLLIQSSSCGKS